MFHHVFLVYPSKTEISEWFSEEEWGREEERTMEWPRFISSRFQRSTTTAVPTAMKANNPTILHEIVRDKKTPVNNIQVHQGRVNSLQYEEHGWDRVSGRGVRGSRGTSEGERVTKFVESGIGVECETHEKYEWCVEEDQSSLSNMRIIWSDNSNHERFNLIWPARSWQDKLANSPNKTKLALNNPTNLGYPLSLMIAYMTGGTIEPRIAGNVRSPM